MRLQLEGTSLSDLQAQVLAEHGTTATIIKVEKVTVGGIRGFFARKHYELIVEITQQPEARAEALQVADALLDLPARVGIAALLEQADEDEGDLNGIRDSASSVGGGETGSATGASVDGVSTRSDTFAGILADLASMTAEPVPKVVTSESPRPLRGAGDLVVVVGMGEDPYIVADTLATTAGARTVSVAGELNIVGAPRVDNRQAALAARVQGVRSGHSVFVAVGLGDGPPDDSALRARGAAIEKLHPDQIWAAVDVGRPPEDTAEWMRVMGALVSVDAVAMVGVQHRLR